MIDPAAKTLEIYLSLSGALTISGVVARGERAESTTLRGLIVDVDRLFD